MRRNVIRKAISVAPSVLLALLVAELMHAGAVCTDVSPCSNWLTRDRPCAARPVAGQSAVCVCNSTYCDEVTRDAPLAGRYICYTSSEGGSRFKKTIGRLKCNDRNASETACTFVLDPYIKYQSIQGFGAAVTGAAAYNLRSLPRAAQEHLINSYFGEKGLQYNMVRVPIGGCDFSLSDFAYNEWPSEDHLLSNYTLASEDYDYKIPVIRKMMEASRTPVHVIAATWSPPRWMKEYSAHNPTCGYVKKEYYQTYADYHIKFVEQYAKAGVPVWAISTTNEPSVAFMNISVSSCLGWTPDRLGKWISENLGPTVRRSSFSDLKILALDDQRFTIPEYLYPMVQECPEVLRYVDGVAVHYYADNKTPPEVVAKLYDQYPDLFVIATEACEGFRPTQAKKVDLGSWSRAESYIKDIIQDLNSNVVGWLDWNFCLDPHGGPTWSKNYVDSPVIVDAERKEFVKQPMFYAMGHFSKFLPRGSRRIEVTGNWSSRGLEHVAFLTPDNTIVFIVYNGSGANAATVEVVLDSRRATLTLEPKSINSVEFRNDGGCGCKKSVALIMAGNRLKVKLRAKRINIEVH